MKQYVIFSENCPEGRVVEEDQLYDFINEDGNVYEIGEKVGDLHEMASKSLEERENEEI